MASNRDTVPASRSLYSTSLGTRRVPAVVPTVESCRSYLLNVYPGLFLTRPSLIQILEDSSWNNGTHPPQTRLLHLSDHATHCFESFKQQEGERQGEIRIPPSSRVSLLSKDFSEVPPSDFYFCLVGHFLLQGRPRNGSF